MPIIWTENLTLKLVTLYSQHECLTNPFHPNFKNKLCRYKAYKFIADCLNISDLTVCDCIKRITYVKTQYCYELSKISAAISCEKYYKPTARWFPIIHKLFFPFISLNTYATDFCKVSGNKINWFEDYPYSDKQTDSVKLRAQKKIYDCPCTICSHEKSYKTKPHICHKIQIEGSDFITSKSTVAGGTSFASRSQKVTQIDAASNTKRNVNDEHETQTDVSYFKTACTSCQVCMTGETPLQSANVATALTQHDMSDPNGTDCIPMQEDIKLKIKTPNEFDMFGKSIAFQLRNINFEIAIKLKKQIQDLIAQERLNQTKSACSDCDSVSCCSECEILPKDMVCSCGLPVIMIKADSSCDSDCKY